MKESMPIAENPPPNVMELKQIKNWEDFEPEKHISELPDQDVMRTLGAWNRYRAERASKNKIMQGHVLRPKAVLSWIRKIVAGETLPDEISFASPDSPQEIREESEAAFDAIAFVAEYDEKLEAKEEVA
jgi:hypothetical protein